MRNQKKIKDKSICIKLDDELVQKLDHTAQVTGKTRSAVARDFISNGEVKAYYGSDKIISKMCKIESRMNEYCHYTLDELAEVRRELAKTNCVIQALSKGTIRESPFTFCLDATRKIDELEKNLRLAHKNLKNLDTELTDCVNIQSDFQQ